MKNVTLKMATLAALLVSAGGQAAAPSAEIKVVGELIAPTCEVTLPNGGVFDFGSINHSLVSDSKPVSLGVKGGSELVVICSASTPLTFKVVDNRLGTASESGSEKLGLGNVNGTGKLGYYKVNAFHPQVDGQQADLFVTAGSSIPNGSVTVAFEQGKRVGWSPSGSRTLAIGKSFSFMMTVEAFLAKRTDMQGGIGEGVSLDGSTTLEFGFGL
ncbi:TPA: DUF1120 domain-containing protein [Serratia marcescens]